MRGLHSGGTVGSLVVSAVARFGEAPAIADGNIRWSYRQFGDAVERFISLFRIVGLGKGDAVSILSGNRAESWAAISAAMVMGLRYTPLHPMAAEDDHVFICEDAENRRFDRRGRQVCAARPRDPSAGARAQTSIVIRRPGRARDLLAELPSAVPAPLVDESATSDIAWLAYTGGTTGRPKGVMIPHRSLVTMALVLYADWDWPAEIRFLAATPISHAAGVTLYPIQLRGGFVRLVQGFEVEAYCRAIEQEKITAAYLVPTLAPTTMPPNCRHMSSISTGAMVAEVHRLRRRYSGHRAWQDRPQGAARAVLGRPQPRRRLKLSGIFRACRGNN